MLGDALVRLAQTDTIFPEPDISLEYRATPARPASPPATSRRAQRDLVYVEPAVRVVIPTPSSDFDPTETAVPWHVLTTAGHEVMFATPDGQRGRADDRMLSGRGLLFWSPVLRARRDARELYEEMTRSRSFAGPLRYDQLDAASFDGLILAGGHAPGMKEYLESTDVQAFAADMVAANKPVGAICHGVLVLARSMRHGASVLAGRRTTALTRSMELSAFCMTAAWLGNYYRTYPQTVQDEVVDACGDAALFEAGPFAVIRDAPDALDKGFTVRDGAYLSARWPGDAYRFAHEYARMLAEG